MKWNHRKKYRIIRKKVWELFSKRRMNERYQEKGWKWINMKLKNNMFFELTLHGIRQSINWRERMESIKYCRPQRVNKSVNKWCTNGVKSEPWLCRNTEPWLHGEWSDNIGNDTMKYWRWWFTAIIVRLISVKNVQRRKYWGVNNLIHHHHQLCTFFFLSFSNCNDVIWHRVQQSAVY